MISGAELLEQAVHLCRSDRNGAMAAYWTGTAPFVMAVLYICQALTRRANGDELVLPASLALAVLWLWMNFWHTVCCDSLWRTVADERRQEWSTRLAVRVMLTNAALQGPGPLVLGMAAIVTLPFPWAHAFYQNCHVYAARFDIAETTRHAGRHATLWPRQNWQLLCCVLFVGLIVFLNVLLAMQVGAQLLNSIFGVQTALAHSRWAIFSLPYLTAAACMTFLVVDPLWKAAHVIRCFQGQARRTGADLRLLLRRVAVMAALALVGVEAPAQVAPAQKYDQAIKEVLQRPEYEWTGRQSRPRGYSAAEPYLTAFRRWVTGLLQAFVDWLRKFNSQAEAPRPGGPPGSELRLAVFGAVVLCLAAVAVLVFHSRRRRTTNVTVAESVQIVTPVDIRDESVTPDQMPTSEWLQLADEFLRSGDTRLAARAIYLAALSQLEGEKVITLGRHKTNREYERELTRRARGAPQVRSTFRAIADAFERSWYGFHAVEESHAVELRSSISRLRMHA